MRQRVLLVDLRAYYAQRLILGWTDLASVESCSDFKRARQLLLGDPPDLLVTNLRLGVYNGLHLVYVSALSRTGVRAIVYSDTADQWALREIRSAGAFFERGVTLPHALPAYLDASLPPVDRRGMVADRRKLFRGGRRAVDVPMAGTRPRPSTIHVDDFDDY